MSGWVIFLAVCNRRKRMTMRQTTPDAVLLILRIRLQVVQKKVRPGYDGHIPLCWITEQNVVYQILMSQLFIQVVEQRIVRRLWLLAMRINDEQSGDCNEFQA